MVTNSNWALPICSEDTNDSDTFPPANTSLSEFRRIVNFQSTYLKYSTLLLKKSPHYNISTAGLTNSHTKVKGDDNDTDKERTVMSKDKHE